MCVRPSGLREACTHIDGQACWGLQQICWGHRQREKELRCMWCSQVAVVRAESADQSLWANEQLQLTQHHQRHAFKRGMPVRLRLHRAAAWGHTPPNPRPWTSWAASPTLRAAPPSPTGGSAEPNGRLLRAHTWLRRPLLASSAPGRISTQLPRSPEMTPRRCGAARGAPRPHCRRVVHGLRRRPRRAGDPGGRVRGAPRAEGQGPERRGGRRGEGRPQRRRQRRAHRGASRSSLLALCPLPHLAAPLPPQL